jgi:predicted DCC family thiol-disulfide oxidoreductase YuxK
MSTEAVIVFDGVCVLCSRWTRFVLRFDRAHHFRLAAMQTEAGRRILSAHGLDPDDPSTFIVIDEASAYTESTALIHVLRRIGGAWRLVAAVLHLCPRPLRDAAYRTIARNRYRWFGRKDLCVVPVPEQRDRFLT